MRTSHKLTQFLLASLALVALAASALAQIPVANNFTPSDQKAGSVLVFPYYNSSSALGSTVNTRLTITNTDTSLNIPANTVAVHLFLIAGCSPADMYMCLTPMQQFSFTAKDWDPDRQGYLIAVAVDSTTGVPRQHNFLIGNAFVNDGDYVGNYGAEAFWRYTGTGVPGPDGANILEFDGVEYDAAPTGFLAEIQSVNDATQRIVHASIQGNLNGTTASVGTVGSSRVYNQNEILKSFSFGLTGCLAIFQVTNATIRTAPQLNVHIPSGEGGTLYYDTTVGSVGLIMTANRHNQLATQWSGIRTIHKRATSDRNLEVPVFIPTC
jgi:hypothetical protein